MQSKFAENKWFGIIKREVIYKHGLLIYTVLTCITSTTFSTSTVKSPAKNK